jgi:peptidylprolyl isomerase
MQLVIEGFREAFSTMVVGERRRLWVPPELTDLGGERVHDGTVVFDLELLTIVEKPETPPDVSAIPDDAVRTASGLAYRVLQPGSGKRHPVPGSVVQVHFAGWTRDGTMFDSSYNHAKPGRFTLDETMPLGWNEALYLMVEGERRRLWIPEDLAYGGQRNRPRGMLVFDVELLTIEPPPTGASSPGP